MAIEFVCNGCSNTLRVPDEHAGKHARCPQCSSVNPIPSDNSDMVSFPPASNEPPPVDLFAGVPEKTKPSAHGNEPPIATPYSPPPQQAQPPYAAPQNPYVAPVSHAATHRSYAQEHRGGLILTLGILSFFCNIMLIPGILAWVMGSADLKEMKAGRMDPSGQGITTAGMVMGIISCCLYGLAIGLNVLFLILGIAAGAAGM